MTRGVRKAIVPAAGFGTRFLPITKSTPKEMLPIVDKPVIQFVIEEAISCGIESILIVTGRGKHAIENHFDHAPDLESHLERQGKQDLAEQVREISEGVDIHFIRQKKQMGLGDAVRLGRSFVGEDPFAVMLGDTIIDPAPDTGIHGLKELLDVFEETGASVVGVRRVPEELIPRYGIVDGDVQSGENLYRLKQLLEKPSIEDAPTNLAIAGRYVFTPEIFECLESTGFGAGGEVQLTDAMNELAARTPVLALAWHAIRYDIGNKADYVRCFLDYALRHPETRDAMRAYLAELA